MLHGPANVKFGEWSYLYGIYVIQNRADPASGQPT